MGPQPQLAGLPKDYPRSFYRAWTDDSAILQQPAGELGDAGPPRPISDLPWFHNVILIGKIKDGATRLWYAQQALKNAWSRAVLVHQIETKLHLRQGRAMTNFKRTLPNPQSDLAQEAHLEVGGEDFYLDLLFYHLRLRCYVVIELKTGPFKPEHAGKMNFYLSAADDILRHPEDRPSIGIILCKSKNKVVAEYALRDSNKPIGVASYRATRALPEELRGGLPDVRQLEKGLE